MRKVIATQHFFEFPDLNSEIDGIYFVSNRHKKSNTIWCWTFCIESGFEQLNAARMSAAGDGSTEPNLYFCPVGRNANESVLPCWMFCRNRRGSPEVNYLLYGKLT